jgi:hypothetical protein
MSRFFSHELISFYKPEKKFIKKRMDLRSISTDSNNNIKLEIGLH